MKDRTYGLFCLFKDHSDLPKPDDRGILTGSLQIEPPAAAPVVVFVYRVREGRTEVVDSQRLHPPGPYSFAFTVPAGAYRLAAFEDVACDFRYDPLRDRATLYHDGFPIVLMPKQTVDRLYLKLLGDRPQRIDFEVTLAESGSPRECSPAGDGVARRVRCKAKPGSSATRARGRLGAPR